MLAQKILLVLIGSIWLIGGNIVVIKSLKEQNLSLLHLLSPSIFFKMRGKDWVYLFILAVVTMTLFMITFKTGWI